MKKDILPEAPRKKGSFFQQQNWYLSAGLVLVIYLILLAAVKLYLVEDNYLVRVVHALPAISVALVVMGWFEKRRADREDKDRKAKRYQARMMLSRLQKKDETARPKEVKKEGS